jgi:hypothetical protein
LDASASPQIIAKIWDRQEADVIQFDLSAEAQLYERVKVVLLTGNTYSNTYIAGNETTGMLGVFDQEPKNLSLLRKIINYVSVKHGMGRVVVGSTMLIRRLTNTNWATPGNTDWCHYGALRGLDAFKRHEAALSIGRIEVPIDIIDGIAAALTYDDPTPEEPFDKYGTGYDEDNKADVRLVAEPKIFPLRNGGTETLNIPCYPDTHKWCQILQKQYREEEILQFLGRLRAFHRPAGEMPVWYSLSCVLPEGAIIDEICQTDATSTNSKDEGTAILSNAVRQNCGVIAYDMSDCIPKLAEEENLDLFKKRGIDLAVGTITSPLFTAAGQMSEDGPYALGYLNREFILPEVDKIDAELGPWFERRKQEFALLTTIISNLELDFNGESAWTYKQIRASYGKKAEAVQSNLIAFERASKLAQKSGDRKLPDPLLMKRTVMEWQAVAALEDYWKTIAAKNPTVDDISSTTENSESVDFSAYGDMLDPLEFVSEALSALTG